MKTEFFLVINFVEFAIKYFAEFKYSSATNTIRGVTKSFCDCRPGGVLNMLVTLSNLCSSTNQSGILQWTNKNLAGNLDQFIMNYA